MPADNNGTIFLGLIGGLSLLLLTGSRGINYQSPVAATRYGDLIMREAAQKNLPPELIRAIIQVESSGDPTAYRQEDVWGTRGLMQVSPIAARDVGYQGDLDRLFDPDTNLAVGTAYLKKMFDRFGADPSKIDNRWNRAVAAYNAGPTTISRYGIVNPEYVDKVKKSIRV